MDLKSMIRTIEDFPKLGISFKDITTLLKDKAVFHTAIEPEGHDVISLIQY